MIPLGKFGTCYAYDCKDTIIFLCAAVLACLFSSKNNDLAIRAANVRKYDKMSITHSQRIR